MALIVEDGTGKADAESLCSVSVADSYHSNLGNTDWAALATPAKEQNLRKATNYLLQKYRQSIKGQRKTTTQSQDWPRTGVIIDKYNYVSDSIVPLDWQHACADLALKAETEELVSDLTRGIKKEKVGPLETEYFEGSPEEKRYQSISFMLSPYLLSSGDAARIIRT